MTPRLEMTLRVLLIAIPLVGLALVLLLRPTLWEPRTVFTSSKVQAHGLLTISLGGLFLYGLAPFLRNLENKAIAPICAALGVIFAYVGLFLALRILPARGVRARGPCCVQRRQITEATSSWCPA